MIQPGDKQPVTVESLLGTALADQSSLSAVEDFARKHEEGEVPAQARYYESLLPASPPGPGQQYSFEVDLDRCTACKACVAACHNLNGLEETEAWRSTGLLLGGSLAKPFQQTVTTACHHCLEPACLKGCPVNAYEKDEETGIVHHLDDQCIGCKYCTLTCPYDVPKYSANLGIVRKCDMCRHRLKDGEAPACVQACPNGAIRIRVVDVEQTRSENEQEKNALLPGTPHPEYTQPTTRYVTEREIPENAKPADYTQAPAEHAHWPLAIMLALSQVSVGGYLVCSLAGDRFPEVEKWVLLVSFLIANAALGAATFHLGRPQFAFRALMGIGHSSLSREIAGLSAFAGAAAAWTVVAWHEHLPVALPDFVLNAEPLLGSGTAFLGLVAVFTSMMLYHVTRRPCWHARYSVPKFYLTTLVSAGAIGLVADLMDGEGGVRFFLATALLVLVKVAVDLSVVRHLHDAEFTPLQRTAWLMVNPLKNATAARVGLAFVGGLLLPLLALGLGSAVLAATSFVVLVGGEIAERYLYFRSMSAVRMPGGATV